MKDTPNIPDISILLQSIEEVRMLCHKQGEIIIDLKADNLILKKENKKLRSENTLLKKEIIELKDKLTSSRHRNDSTNSSMAPSSDIHKLKNTNSLRQYFVKKVHKDLTMSILKGFELG